jgi:hypothetical protein
VYLSMNEGGHLGYPDASRPREQDIIYMSARYCWAWMCVLWLFVGRTSGHYASLSLELWALSEGEDLREFKQLQGYAMDPVEV